MPRGRASGYDTQRAQILARAAQLFAQQGYSGTSMNQVAEACSVSKPSLYHYVDDKYQLLVEITQGHIDRLRALVDDEAAQTATPPDVRLRALIERFMAAYADAQAQHRVLTEDVKFLEPKDRRRVIDGEREVVAAFARAIAAARPDLGAAALDKPLTMLLFGMMNWMFTWLRPNGALTHADMTPVVTDLFFGGLGAVRVPAPASIVRRPAATTAARTRARGTRPSTAEAA
jgi:TetR/AcrR family transcriptional regulator